MNYWLLKSEPNVWSIDQQFKVTNASDAHYLIMTNKASFNKNDKRTCFDIYKGKDFYFVKRGNLILSKFTKIKEID